MVIKIMITHKRILIIQNIDHTKYDKAIGINQAIVKKYTWGPVSVAK